MKLLKNILLAIFMMPSNDEKNSNDKNEETDMTEETTSSNEGVGGE